MAGKQSYLCHDFVLTFLHVLPISFHDGLQEPQVVNTSAMCFNAVDKVMDHTVTDLIAQIVVVHKDVTHRLSFQQLLETKQQQCGLFYKSFFLIVFWLTLTQKWWKFLGKNYYYCEPCIFVVSQTSKIEEK